MSWFTKAAATVLAVNAILPVNTTVNDIASTWAEDAARAQQVQAQQEEARKAAAAAAKKGEQEPK